MSQSTYDLIDTALITGGAGGIGRALAENLIKAGKKVIIAGRTESKLQATSKEIGADYYVLDTSKVDSIPSFVKQVLKDHEDLNCLINNAGVQRPFEIPGSNFSNGDYGFDLAKADQEIDTNIRGPMHLAIALLPHFTSLPSGKQGVIINVSSVLGFAPISLVNPVYNGSKAWLHFFTVNMRTQLAKNQTRVKVIEIVPPTVATDLHRERTNPDDNKKANNQAALELPEFMAEIEEGLRNGEDTISAGSGKQLVKIWQDGMGKFYNEKTGN
ncbi:hypothetical protein PMZ80_000362 [Knufia obscura]|uniref:Short-chain dehydrogenase n=2 Tax=Knufia TaxID=430999 RepID=A0AAN8EIX4_9EURO|nr:hypothetical protein PMZ80_000362 [Knufia obscura]KAK5956709.1 hypothetical protein OHC33_002196 [Knufia fluminis]